ncbi:uncharacterized protein [Pseudorca crassidens]|uniref:uncharacterized protein n=1 Tax=Pseudorca crassidens TaxID=82174 RepID=UPI00352ED153
MRGLSCVVPGGPRKKPRRSRKLLRVWDPRAGPGAGRRQGGSWRASPVVSLQTPSCAAPLRGHNRGPTRPEATCRSGTWDQGTGPAARPLSGSGWAEDFLCGGLSQGTVRAPDRPAFCRAPPGHAHQGLAPCGPHPRPHPSSLARLPRPPGLSSRGRSGFHLHGLNGLGSRGRSCSGESTASALQGLSLALPVPRLNPPQRKSSSNPEPERRRAAGPVPQFCSCTRPSGALEPVLWHVERGPRPCSTARGSWPQESEGRRGPAHSQQVRGECPAGLASRVPILGPAGPGGTQETFDGTSGQAARGGRA